MSIEVSNLDHLGLVAGIIDDIGIVEKINQRLGNDKREIISAGLVVKAMILNGLGLVSSPLYMFSRFFEGKALKHLLGPSIEAQHLNDDRLGRILDELYKYGLSSIFIDIAVEVVKKYQIDVQTTHLDSTSLTVEGEYATDYGLEEERPNRPIKITYGYSRDKRPDLKQFMMDLICSSDAGVPLWLQMGDGNESDTQQFPQIMASYKNQMTWDSLIVVDGAFYSQENLQISQNIKWISRVPSTLKAAEKMVRGVKSSELEASNLEGYRYKEFSQTYGGVEQRWLLVESEQRRQSDLEKLQKKIAKEKGKYEANLKTLSRQTFACIPDAKKAALKLLNKAKYYELTDITVVESKNPKKKGYQVTGLIQICPEQVECLKNSAGRFILATNVLDEEKLTTEGILATYKDQQTVERGFRFMKDPMFFTDSVFLKSPHRIEALGLIMGLCLLVYTLGQREIRQQLKRVDAKVPNQLGRPTDRPTLRWIFQCFQSIHVVEADNQVHISNITAARLHLLKFFPPSCQRYYLLG
jgi:transposase